MPVERKLFAIVVWLGVIANWSFAIWAVFFDPHQLLATFGLGDSGSILWLYNYAFLLMLLSLFYIPAAHDPFRYRANAWLLIVGRLVPASSFFIGVALGFMPKGFLKLGAGDATFGLIELILLVRLFRIARLRPGSAAWARAKAGGAALVVIAILGGLAAWGYHRLTHPAMQVYASDVDHLKYGSVGVEAANGIPYRVWAAMPLACDKLLPSKDYRGFGFVWEPDHPTPVGMPLETVIVPRVGVNCGLCHVGTVRETAAAPRQMLIGAPNTTIDVQRYFAFLFGCAASPDFSAGKLIEAMQSQGDLSLMDSLLYRFVVIPQTRKGLLEQRRELAWMDGVPPWGPGRVDGFNPAKVQVLKQPYDGTLDAVDIPALWNWRPREGFSLHWDGLNTSLREVFLNSGIGNGAKADTIEVAGLDRLRDWVLDLKPPPYPFAIDAGLAERGKPIFDAHCVACHAFGGAKVGEPMPIGLIGTDRHRLDAFTPAALAGFEGLDDYAWRYTHFRKTNGYVAAPLDGIWARAPYLHNGSVATLRDLLAPAALRPKQFYRGYDVYDQRNVGFASAGPDAAREGRLYDATLPGNSPMGHEYGTDLSVDDGNALLEYMKTL